MTRRELREQVFLMLFRVEFHNEEELEEQMQLFFEDESIAMGKDLDYITSKFRGIREHLTELDTAIDEVAQGWKTNRMAKVDLALIRLALYEIRFDDDVPTSVAINEAVELAKQYGADDSPAFVNGVLAKLV